MCLGIPGLVEEMWESDGIPMARVDFGGARTQVCTMFVPELHVGTYVIVHVGFAIAVLDEESALATLGLLEQIGVVDQ